MKPGGQAPRVVPPAAESAPAIASSRTPEPQINYPRITGATPGRPFLFRIPAIGRGAARIQRRRTFRLASRSIR